MNIGKQAPSWRIPTLVNGQLTYNSLQQFLGKPLVLCCVSSLTKDEANFINSQFERFKEFETLLAVLIANDPLLKQLSTQHLTQFRPPLLTDPLQRLSRSLKLTRSLPVQRCETLFFDQQCRLEFRLIHDLNLRGITMVLEMVERLGHQISSTKSSEPLLSSELVQPHY